MKRSGEGAPLKKRAANENSERKQSALNERIARKFFDEVFNQGKLSVVDEIFDPDYIGYSSASLKGPIKGRAGIKEFVSTYRTAFPDIYFSFDDILTSGDKVVVRWTTRGTHKGMLMDIRPTEKQISVTGIGIAQIVNAQIFRSFSQVNVLRMMEQLGVVQQIGLPGDEVR
jgi:predicted ester cyclase